MRPEDVIATYDREGTAWAAMRDRRLTERPWLDRALAIAPHSRGRRRVLDLGCGAGRPIAEYLLDRGCLVTGVDASRPMIELFARVVPRAVALHADMRTLRLSEVFDLVIAWDSFFHLSPDDQRATFPVFAAHARRAASSSPPAPRGRAHRPHRRGAALPREPRPRGLPRALRGPRLRGAGLLARGARLRRRTIWMARRL
jgi:SAM-dependent methyltransferase